MGVLHCELGEVAGELVGFCGLLGQFGGEVLDCLMALLLVSGVSH